MALKVCNQCGSAGYTDECAACLAAGRGSVRDYHYAHEAEEAVLEAAENTEAAPSEPGDEDEAASEEETEYDDSHPDDAGVLSRDDLDQHSRNRLSSIAAERGLDASGTKEDLIERLVGEPQE